ncbi:MAG: hypothetical protein ACTSRS_16250 [Candidatus Helarchaeota archaeon]
MVDEICIIGWRNDIGAYSILQYPRETPLSVQEVMQIYTSHRQNTLYPNFVSLTYKKKKFASFFTGMKTTEFKGAPNFIVAIQLDESESPNLFREILPTISTEFFTNLFGKLPRLLEELNIEGFFILTHEPDIGSFPILIYPSHLKITNRIQSEILKQHNQTKRERHSLSIGENIYVSLKITSVKNSSVMAPTCIIVFLLKEGTDLNTFEKRVKKHAENVFSEFITAIKDLLEKLDEMKYESIITEELNERPIIQEEDIIKLSENGEEPSILLQDEGKDMLKKEGQDFSAVIDDQSIEPILKRMKEMVHQKIENEEEKIDSISGDLDLHQLIHNIRKELREKEKIIDSQREAIEILQKKLKEKERERKKLLIIIKSMRKYVSY